jgi:hypothetical protein
MIADTGNLEYLKENIAFPEYISDDLQLFLTNTDSPLSSFEINKKERYKALSMKIEANSETQTNEVVGNILEKLTQKINLDTYKKAIVNLKEKMSTGDMDAFHAYSEIVKKAKEMKIK